MTPEVPMDTIVSPITAPGHAPVGAVRLSGPNVEAILLRLVQNAPQAIAEPRTVVYSAIYDELPAIGHDKASERRVLDQGLVIFFRAPQSFTGEDCAEFHLHGSPFIIERLIANCVHAGARLAEPGEFSKRAFINGKIDLSQAEAVADLIAAETELQARSAREQLAGRLSQAIADVGEPLRDLLAEIEAAIDFPDEGIEPQAEAEWTKVVLAVRNVLGRYLESFRSGRLYREGASVVFVGLPNAGKSSLLNSLLGEERAIVTPRPGTTRDTIEERVSIDGLLVRFTDTAGLYETEDGTADEVERLGIERSWQCVERADLLLYVFDLTKDFSAEESLVHRVKESNHPLLFLGNKSDLLSEVKAGELQKALEQKTGGQVLIVSATTGLGISQLKRAVSEQLLGGSRHTGGPRIAITNQRHFQALSRAFEQLGDVLGSIERGLPPEVVTIDIRGALDSLGDIIGVTHTEDILSRIFAKFCIGK